MKIAFYNLTTTTAFGGIETFNIEMARILAARGHRVDVYGGRSSPLPDLPEAVGMRLYAYLKRSHVPDLGTRFRKFVERLSFGLFAFRDLSGGRYDFIYISKPFDLPVALAASRSSGAKVIFGSGGTEFFPGYCLLARRADFFFACSSFNRDQVAAHCGLKPLVLPNGVDTRLFSPGARDNARGEVLGLTPGRPVIITACRLVGWKGIQHALKALSLLRLRGYRPCYLIAGDGEYRPALESIARELNLSDQVHFLGRIDHRLLPSYYSLADVAVFPSVANETFGMSIAEAMSCGIPVVSTSVGGIPEVVGTESGLLVAPGDGEALAEALVALLSDEGLRQQRGQAARARVISEFSWESVADRLEAYLAQPETSPDAAPGLPCPR